VTARLAQELPDDDPITPLKAIAASDDRSFQRMAMWVGAQKVTGLESRLRFAVRLAFAARLRYGAKG
jgi:hypothetical protein